MHTRSNFSKQLRIFVNFEFSSQVRVKLLDFQVWNYIVEKKIIFNVKKKFKNKDYIRELKKQQKKVNYKNHL